MGTSKRYADHFDRKMSERILETAMREREPSTLCPAEIDLEREPLTRTPAPRPVRAWVRYGETPMLVEASAVAWTDHAVAIKWPTPDGGEHKAWVWAAAVPGVAK